MTSANDQRELLPYRPVALAELQAAAADSPARLPGLLATKFRYDVEQGGFSQLMYNLRGEFLRDTEDVLIAAGATVAHDYYVRAIEICLGAKADYFKFIASNYVDENDVKHSLQVLSVEYLQRRVGFVDEAAVYLSSCPR